MKITRLTNETFLVMGNMQSSVVYANGMHDLADKLNEISKSNGIPCDTFITSVENRPTEPDFNKTVIMVLLPIGEYRKVLFF